MAPLKDADVDTVILGCTHYPLISPMLRRLLGPRVSLIDSAEETAREISAILERKGMTNDRAGRRRLSFRLHGGLRGIPRGGRTFSATADPGGKTTVSDDARPGGRGPAELRPLKLTPDFVSTADGSVFIELGGTRVLCSAQVVNGVPGWRRGSGKGWLTAEYSLLPSSTRERTPREAVRGRQDGRTVEIQRFIGRSLRAVIDLEGAWGSGPSTSTVTWWRPTGARAARR